MPIDGVAAWFSDAFVFKLIHSFKDKQSDVPMDL